VIIRGAGNGARKRSRGGRAGVLTSSRSQAGNPGAAALECGEVLSTGCLRRVYRRTADASSRSGAETAAGN
jgi:hypothetical protein